MLNARRDFMADTAPDPSVAADRTAVMVMNAGSTPVLCPFFGKCDGILLINSAVGSKEFHPRDRSGTKPLCKLVLELKPHQLICGFIDESEKEKLRAAGIDVRLGSCSCPIDELVSGFHSLPRA
jgi:hypothetical protein